MRFARWGAVVPALTLATLAGAIGGCAPRSGSPASGTGVTQAAAGASAETGRAAVLGPWLERLRWVNARPIEARGLSGKVVLVEFWTFDCINCRRTVPAMKRLNETYRAAPDVALIGFHTPELEQEYDAENVRRAIDRLDIGFPVAQDNDQVAWNAFGNRYWPALYLIDRRGRIRDVHVGELHVGTAAWNEWLRSIEALRREPA